MHKFKYIKIDHIHYTKSTISQKIKVVQKKLMNKKIRFRALRIFPVNLVAFELFFCWLVTREPDSETLTNDTREPVGSGGFNPKAFAT